MDQLVRHLPAHRLHRLHLLLHHPDEVLPGRPVAIVRPRADFSITFSSNCFKRNDVVIIS
jgi:hypothetical protein